MRLEWQRVSQNRLRQDIRWEEKSLLEFHNTIYVDDVMLGVQYFLYRLFVSNFVSTFPLLASRNHRVDLARCDS